MAFDWSSTEHILIAWLSIGQAQVDVVEIHAAVVYAGVKFFGLRATFRQYSGNVQ
jgi:hypothetical protein